MLVDLSDNSPEQPSFVVITQSPAIRGGARLVDRDTGDDKGSTQLTRLTGFIR
jgi:hypothetical protein